MFKGWLGSVITTVGLGITMSIAPNVLAAEFPRDLSGIWVDKDGKEYRIEVQGNTILFQAPPDNTQSQPRTYQGNFIRTPFEVSFVPHSLIEFGNDNIPAAIRQQLMGRGFRFQGQIEHNVPNKPDTIIWHSYSDDVTYDRQGTKISHYAPHTGETPYELTRKGGYRIGTVYIDEKLFKQRIDNLVQRVRADIDRMRNETLPQAEREIAQQQAQLSTLATQSEAEAARRDPILTEIRRLQQEIMVAARERTPQYDEWIRQKSAIEQTLPVLEQTRQDYIKKGNNAGLNSMNQQLATKKRELADINRRIQSRFPQTSEITRMEGLLQTQTSQLQVLDQRINSLSREYDSLLSDLESRKNRLEVLKLRIESREHELAYYQRKPIIERIELKAGEEPRFIATSGQDEELLRAFNEDIDAIDQQSRNFQNMLPEAVHLVAEADQERQAMREEYRQAGVRMTTASNAVYDIIMENRWWRAGVEFSGNLVDVIMAAREGAWAGVAGEMTQKLVEFGVQGGQAFQMYDESSLRDQIYGNVAEEPMGDIAGFAVQQAIKTPLVLLKEGGLQLYERKGLMEQADEARKFLENVKPGVRSLKQARSEAITAIERTSREVTSQKDLLREAMRRRVAGNAAGFDTASDSYRLARQHQREAVRNFARVGEMQQDAIRTMRETGQRFKSARERITEMRKVSGGNLEKLGKSIGAGLAVDAIKASLNSRFDRQEEAAWMQYFETELSLASYYKLYHMASNDYWNKFDMQKSLEEQVQSLQILREQVELERQEYLASAQQPGGFHIERNNEFTSSDAPLTLNISILGPAFGENVFLEKSEGPPTNNSYQPVEGAPIRPPQKGNLPNTNSQPTTVNWASLDKTSHYFQFPVERLNSLQRQGRLPLRVFKR